MRPPRIAVVGSGALGLYYGARLARQNNSVAFLARRDYQHLRTQGLRVQSIEGNFALTPDEYAVFKDAAAFARESHAPVDLVLIGLKTTANEPAYRESVLPLWTPGHTSVLCLQNGLGNEALLVEIGGVERARTLFGGTAFLCSNRTGPGEIDHTEHGLIHLAPYLEPAPASDAAEKIAALIRASGVECSARPGYIAMRWRKQIWNVPFNALCTIHDRPTDALLAMSGMRDRVATIMREVISLGGAVHASLRSSVTAAHTARVYVGDYALEAECDAIIAEQLAKTAAMGAYHPSMLLDARAGRPIESAAIVDACLAERDAHAPRLPVPEIERLAAELRNT